MSQSPPLPKGYDTGTGWVDDGQVIDTFQLGGRPGITWASYVVRYWHCDYHHTDQPIVATLAFTVDRRPSSIRDGQPYSLDVGSTLTHLTRGEVERVAKAHLDGEGSGKSAGVFLASRRMYLYLKPGNIEAVRQAAQKALDFVPAPEAVSATQGHASDGGPVHV